MSPFSVILVILSVISSGMLFTRDPITISGLLAFLIADATISGGRTVEFLKDDSAGFHAVMLSQHLNTSLYNYND
ncbi:MAG: hypothetical protein Kow0021_15680 [Methanothermobacter thermautotrophicus]